MTTVAGAFPVTGHVTEIAPPGVLPTQLGYDSNGRLQTITQGTRTWTLAYDVLGNLTPVTDPLSEATSFEYDLAGRVTKQIFPDLRQVLFGYDFDGNLASLTPPGKPSHGFAYTPIDLQASYEPPQPQPPIPSTQTLYSYNHDRQLTQVTRPDGGTIDFTYGSTSGQLQLETLPGAEGQLTYQYGPVTGQLSSVTGPGTETLAFGYQGPLLTSTTWSGDVAGSVTHTYDSDLSVATEQVNASTAVAFGYDNDKLLTGATLGSDSLAVTRDAPSGRVSGTTLGAVADTYTYDGYGDVATYAATYGGQPLYDYQVTQRDDLGRIAEKVETIGGTTDTYDYTYDLSGRLTDASNDGTRGRPGRLGLKGLERAGKSSVKISSRLSLRRGAVA